MNFGPKPAFRRKIFTNDKKRHRQLPEMTDAESA